MEPIKINVNVEVGLKQATIEALALILNPLRGCTCASGTESETKTEPEPAPKTPIPPAPRPMHKPVPDPASEAEKPKTAGADPEGTGAEYDDDDLPPADAPSPKKTPSEDDARQAVKAARSRGVTAKTIKDYMKNNFDIASSVECPAERRQELIDGLNKLAA